MWVSLRLINPCNFLMPQTMNFDCLHRICDKGNYAHRKFDSYRPHMFHDYHWNTSQGFLGVGFCANNEACNVVNNRLISPPISGFPCNQLLTSVVWILALVNIHISGRIQSCKRFIRFLVGSWWRRLPFIFPLWDNIHLLTLRMLGLQWHWS